MVTSKTTRLVLTVGALALAAAAGCRGDRSESRPRQFFPDMDDSPKFKPQTQTPFFADGRAMRQPVENTVAFGVVPDAADPARERYLKDDAGYYFGTGADGKYLATMPARVVVDKKLLERGMERFNIYCSVCHGYDGYGKGTVGELWRVPVANFHDPKFTDAAQDQSRDGYIFHTIRNGLPADDPKQPMRMPSYGYSVSEADAWAIVAYVRTLQAQQAGTTADLSPAARETLEKTRSAEIDKAKARRAAEAAAAAKPVGNAAPAPKAPEVKP
jgi:mono/diheme cytochrome c family protein